MADQCRPTSSSLEFAELGISILELHVSNSRHKNSTRGTTIFKDPATNKQMVDNFNELMKLYYAEAVTQLQITDRAEI